MSKNTVMTGLLVGAISIACCGPDDPVSDGGPNGNLDGSNPDGGVDGGVADGGNNTDGGQTDGGADGGADAGPDGGVKVDAGPDADSDWEFALAVLNGRKWAGLIESSPTPVSEGTFLLGEDASCPTGKKLKLNDPGTKYCFDPSTMTFSREEDNIQRSGKFTFCQDCAFYTGSLKERCLLHDHVSGPCHPHWSDQWFVDGAWILITTTVYDGSTGKSTRVQGD